MFVIWVVSPFITLLALNTVFKHHQAKSRLILYLLMRFITTGSLIGYNGILTPIGAKPAAIFLIIPFISWLLILLTIIIFKIIEQKKSVNKL